MTRDAIGSSVYHCAGEFWGDEWIEGDGARRERRDSAEISEHSHYGFLHEVAVCAATGRQGVPIEVEHLPDNCWAMNKVAGGMSQKPHYCWCVPLGQDLHDLKTSRVGYQEAFRRMRWPIENTLSGPLATAIALVGFSTFRDVDGARRWLIDCAVQRAAKP